MSTTAERWGATRILAVAAYFVIVTAGMKAAASILVPFLLAVFIAVITAPVFLGLRRRGVPAAVALLLMILMLAVLGFVGAGIVRASLNSFSRNVPKYQARLEEQTEDLGQWLAARGIEPPDATATDVLNPQVLMRYFGTVAGAVSSALTQALLILLVVAFILLEAAILPAKVKALPGLSEETWARMERIVEDIRRYVSLKTVMSLLTGVLVTLVTAILGVDYSILLGLLAFVLNYVPNIGSFIAAIPGVILAFIQFGPGSAAITTIAYVVINVGVSNVIEPRFLGRGLGLSPLVILISMIFWGWVLGPIGMLLSVPLTMTAKIALESGDQTRWIALLMGSGLPKPPASASDQGTSGQGPDRAKSDRPSRVGPPQE